MSQVTMILTTRKKAEEYAKTIADFRKEEVFIFPTEPGTQAYEMGYRFGTCLASEKNDYEMGGAEFVGSVKPGVSP